MLAPQEIEIQLSDITIRGLSSVDVSTSAPRVLCLHGWLDNANSFYPLLPLLPKLHCVAIDMPGHGRSSHLQHRVPYTIANSAHYVLQVANELGWDEFSIVGHSLGGCIAPICAIAEPMKVKNLVSIDALGPIAEPASALPARLGRFHREMIHRSETPSRVFSDLDQAISSRLNATKMNRASARLIVERQTENTNNGELRWSFDTKLRVASPSYFTEDQVQSILQSIQCPTLCIIAANGFLAHSEHLEQRRRCIDSLKCVRLPGNHHLHMDDPPPVADAINDFLNQ